MTVVKVPGGMFGSYGVKNDTDGTHHGHHDGIHPCWRTSDNSIHCPVVKRDSYAQPCFAAPGGETVCPMTKREDCWEAVDGQIHCTNPPKAVKKREDCWEAPDGRETSLSSILV